MEDDDDEYFDADDGTDDENDPDLPTRLIEIAGGAKNTASSEDNELDRRRLALLR